ncbi:MAG: tRNA (adenosine(37)-N6)-threonylcarbamoyltransferase complex dimerization subunit type 1 TsaB [Dactylosporangium sp.]|nr:tRNA (adenosine(37)-N6)-threonylcarbamoyltransferase complex dimerization subunit type 1 TsaB [Dactylosporangium sp.]
MSIVLALDTASGRYSAAVASAGAVVSHRVVDRTEVDDVGSVARSVLDEAGLRLPEVTLIAVCTGPGNLAAVRNGVAYANGLAFSLGLPIFAASSLQLLAFAAARDADTEVLAVRPSAAGTIYAGMFRGSSLQQLVYGAAADVVKQLTAGRDTIVVAGRSRPSVAELATIPVVESGIVDSDAPTLCRFLVSRPEPDLVSTARPLTETSPEFASSKGVMA